MGQVQERWATHARHLFPARHLSSPGAAQITLEYFLRAVTTVPSTIMFEDKPVTNSQDAKYEQRQ